MSAALVENNTIHFVSRGNSRAGPEVAQVVVKRRNDPPKVEPPTIRSSPENGLPGGVLFHVKQPCPSESVECAFRFHVKQVYLPKNGLEGRCISPVSRGTAIPEKCAGQKSEHRQLARNGTTRRQIVRTICTVFAFHVKQLASVQNVC